MIQLYIQDQPAGEISEAQLEFLIRTLEEESLSDQDYAVTSLTLGLFESEGMDQSLLSLLRNALSGKDEIIIRWERG
jgi:hypothetical protein